jgi:uncharacterized protein (DUF1684 family)
MFNRFYLFLLVAGMWGTAVTTAAQSSYSQALLQHRQEYIASLITDKHSPLKAEDTVFLDFFEPDPTYKVRANVQLVKNKKPFDMATYNGKKKPYRKYAVLHFRLLGQLYSLEVYQSVKLSQDPKYKNHLFLPFKDLTNYETTYGGGRYLDLSIPDIQGEVIEIDFNKAYNPYCAYSDGYSCPIPPDANKLPVAIPAGEKMYRKKHTE